MRNTLRKYSLVAAATGILVSGSLLAAPTSTAMSHTGTLPASTLPAGTTGSDTIRPPRERCKPTQTIGNKMPHIDCRDGQTRYRAPSGLHGKR